MPPQINFNMGHLFQRSPHVLTPQSMSRCDAKSEYKTQSLMKHNLMYEIVYAFCNRFS
jgi:hypothetical protein